MVIRRVCLSLRGCKYAFLIRKHKSLVETNLRGVGITHDGVKEHGFLKKKLGHIRVLRKKDPKVRIDTTWPEGKKGGSLKTNAGILNKQFKVGYFKFQNS